MKKERLSNFELLRIISMLIILISHFNIHGNFTNVQTHYFLNELFIDIFVFGTVANHIFIIITGYFMINSDVKYNKIIVLLMQMFFYSIVIPIVLKIIGVIQLNYIDIIKMMFPIVFGNWFCIFYIILYCFIPTINILINKLNKLEFRRLITICLILFSIVPMLTANKWKFSMLALFITDYLIGAYIRIYKDKEKNKKYINVLILGFLFLVASVITIKNIGEKLNSQIIVNNSRYFIVTNTSIFVIIVSVCMVIIFKNIRIKNNSIINYLASSTLGVYLIHENNYLRDIIWNKVWPNSYYYNSIAFIPLAILKIIVIYICCIIIDKIRYKIFGKIEDKISRKVCNLKNGKIFSKYNYTSL